MKVVRLNSGFAGYSDAAFEIKAQLIITSVDKNIHFEAPTPTIPELLDGLAAFSDAVTAAGTGDRVMIAERNKARLELETLLRELAAYVTLVAKGDRAILASCGFDIRKEAESRPAVTAPTGFEVTAGRNPGEALVKLTGTKNGKHYRHEYTTAPVTENSVWIVHTDSQRTHLFDGLKRGVEYAFRSAASGKSGAVVYSNVVAYIVQ